jgi:hypothetical protein
LRRSQQHSPQATATADFQRAKAEWLALRIAKHKREHILTAECDSMLDEAVGIPLTHMSSIPALLFPTDLPVRRRAEAIVLQIRQAIADVPAPGRCGGNVLILVGIQILATTCTWLGLFAAIGFALAVVFASHASGFFFHVALIFGAFGAAPRSLGWGRSTQDLVQTLDDLRGWKVSVLAQTGFSFDPGAHPERQVNAHHQGRSSRIRAGTLSENA